MGQDFVWKGKYFEEYYLDAAWTLLTNLHLSENASYHLVTSTVYGLLQLEQYRLLRLKRSLRFLLRDIFLKKGLYRTQILFCNNFRLLEKHLDPFHRCTIFTTPSSAYAPIFLDHVKKFPHLSKYVYRMIALDSLSKKISMSFGCLYPQLHLLTSQHLMCFNKPILCNLDFLSKSCTTLNCSEQVLLKLFKTLEKTSRKCEITPALPCVLLIWGCTISKEMEKIKEGVAKPFQHPLFEKKL